MESIKTEDANVTLSALISPTKTLQLESMYLCAMSTRATMKTEGFWKVIGRDASIVLIFLNFQEKSNFHSTAVTRQIYQLATATTPSKTEAYICSKQYALVESSTQSSLTTGAVTLLSSCPQLSHLVNNLQHKNQLNPSCLEVLEIQLLDRILVLTP